MVHLVVWIVVIMMLGLVDLVNFEFDPSRFLTANYLTEVSTLIFAGVLVFTVTLFLKYLDNKEQDYETREQDKEITTLLSDKDSYELFSFCIEENLDRREKTYIKNKEDELESLISKITLKYPKSAQVYFNGTEKEKEEDKWCQKINQINAQLEETYIKNNRNHLPAHFTIITPSFILSGVNTSNKESAVEDPSNYVKQAIKDNWINFLMPSTIIMIILSMIMTRTDTDPYVIMFVILIKVILLLIQRYSAIIYSGPYYKKTFVSDVKFRFRLACKFLIWTKNRSSKVKEVLSDERQQQSEREIRDADEL